MSTRVLSLVRRASLAPAMIMLAMVGVAFAISQDVWPPQAGTGSDSKVISRYFLEFDGGMRALNPFLTDEDLKFVKEGPAACAGRSAIEPCSDTPALFVGLGLHADGRLVGISDRGPLQNCKVLKNQTGDAEMFDTGLNFVVPKWAPVLAELRLDTKIESPMDSTVFVVNHCYLRNEDGSPTTGIANSPQFTSDQGGFSGRNRFPVSSNCKAELKSDDSGLDVHDIKPIHGTDYCIGVDEGSPGVFVFNCNFNSRTNCGKVAARYVPEDIADKLQDSKHQIKGVLPKLLSSSDRGFHSVSVSPDGKSAITILKGAMDLQSAKDTPGYEVPSIHVIKLDLSDPLDVKVSGHHLYPAESLSRWGYDDDAQQVRQIMVQGAFWAAAEAGACPNEPILLIMESANKQTKLFLADISDTSNLHGSTLLDEYYSTITESGITAPGLKVARKQLVFDSEAAQGWDVPSELVSSVIVIPDTNGCVVGIGDSNYFGMAGINSRSSISLIQLGTCLPEAFKEIGGTVCNVPGDDPFAHPSNKLDAMMGRQYSSGAWSRLPALALSLLFMAVAHNAVH